MPEQLQVWPSFKDITKYGIVAKMEPIIRGGSPHKKYFVEMLDGRRFFLRISNDEKETIRWFFLAYKHLFQAGIPMPEPIDWGHCEEGIYQLFAWINGKVLFDMLPTMSEDEAYATGVKIGEVLLKIHECPPPAPLLEKPISSRKASMRRFVKKFVERMLGRSAVSAWQWGQRFKQRLDTQLHQIEQEPMSFDFQSYRRLHEYVLRGYKRKPWRFASPVVFHGDYGSKNMIMADKRLVLTDFSFGINELADPMWDIGCFIYSTVRFSPEMVLGFAHGYFDTTLSERVWKKIAFYETYTAVRRLYGHTLSSACFRATHIKACAILMHYYGNMRRTVPLWYCEKGEPKNIHKLKYHSCQNIENFCLTFTIDSSKGVWLVPCKRYVDSKIHEISISKEGVLATYFELRSKIIGESTNTALKIEQNRYYTLPCINCSEYKEHSWVTADLIQKISIEYIPERDLAKALEIIQFAQEQGLMEESALQEGFNARTD